MFTGLIQEKSPLMFQAQASGGMKIEISKPPQWIDIKLGESIAVNGACLTVVKENKTTLEFFVGLETLNKSHFSDIHLGQCLNLERSLAFGDRLGGHMVTGHVDGIAEVLKTEASGDCLHITFKVSPEHFRNIIPKGSVCLNGVSLTVNSVSREEKTVEVFLIPETLARTNLNEIKVGDMLNLECDQYVKIIAHQFSLIGDLSEHRP